MQHCTATVAGPRAKCACKHSVACAAARAASGAALPCQAAANAAALLRMMADDPAVCAAGAGTRALRAAMLLPVVQHTTRRGAPAATLLLQVEFVQLLRQELARDGAAVPGPVPEGVAQPGPPRGGSHVEAVLWYSVEQALLCCMQARRCHRCCA